MIRKVIRAYGGKAVIGRDGSGWWYEARKSGRLSPARKTQFVRNGKPLYMTRFASLSTGEADSLRHARRAAIRSLRAA